MLVVFVLGLDIFTGINDLKYEQRILKSPCLQYRRASGDMTETFKITDGFYDPETVCSMFKLTESAETR